MHFLQRTIYVTFTPSNAHAVVLRYYFLKQNFFTIVITKQSETNHVIKNTFAMTLLFLSKFRNDGSTHELPHGPIFLARGDDLSGW